MKILVSCIPYDGGKSGISTYVRETVRALRDAGHELTLIVEPDGAAERDLAGCGSFFRAPGWTRRAPLSMLWHLLFLPRIVKRRFGGFGGFFICAANRRVCSSHPLPTVATVHDLANFRIKGKYSRSRMFYLAHVLPHFARKAHHLVAVSGATRDDMVRFWRVKPEDATVLYNGLPSIPAGGAGKGKNLLYISRIEHPGKNHVRLIEAYGKLPRDLAERHPLVLAGADWRDAGAVRAAAAASPHADLIRFTGFVPEGEMERLWSEAGFYVFPSLFEGFGLTLAEAMARGVPSAASRNGSLGEIAGDAAVTFDPYVVDSIADALSRLFSETPAERAARISRGRERAKMFSWSAHARGVAGLLARRDPVKLFGIPVSPLREGEAVGRIVSLAAERLAKGARPAFVATLNVDFVANAVGARPFGGNGELWGYLRNADLVTADGMPIVLLSRLLGKPLPERVTGADMVPEICRACAAKGLSVYVLGGDAGAVKEAFANLAVPGLDVAGIDSPAVRLDAEDPGVVRRINAAGPGVLFVALGNPKQELWMGRHAGELRAGAMIGVGGTFNFIAGRVKRAPAWMRRSGLEWIYRMIQEPGRLWRRYAFGLVKFSWLSLIHLCGGYRR
ncbi:MAG: WecB/TagA/CpsF family glycosyltransferase [Kiritimatiellae bacterium]|nr:WecB/TagA/CpsF family glycosyltransferase [Kiritimatiellia bacterium]